MKKGYEYKKFRNKMRRICEEDDCYLDKHHPSKRSRRQGENDKNLFVTSDHIIFKEIFLYVVQG